MRIYRHKKTPNAFSKKRRAVRRKAEGFETRERLFGVDFPAFGASLGAKYDPLSGALDKDNRAKSIGIGRLSPASSSAEVVLNVAGTKQITVNTTFEVAGDLYDDIESLNDTNPTAVESLMTDAIASMYGVDPADITIISISFASISVQFVYTTAAVVQNNTFDLTAQATVADTTAEAIVQTAIVSAANSSTPLTTNYTANYDATSIAVQSIPEPTIAVVVVADADEDDDSDSSDSDSDAVVDVDTDSDGFLDSVDDFPDDNTRNDAVDEYRDEVFTLYSELTIQSNDKFAGRYIGQTSDGSLGDMYRHEDWDNDNQTSRYYIVYNPVDTAANPGKRYELGDQDGSSSRIALTSHRTFDYGVNNSYTVTNLIANPGPNPPFMHSIPGSEDEDGWYYPLYNNTYGLGSYHKHVISGNTYYMEDSVGVHAGYLSNASDAPNKLGYYLDSDDSNNSWEAIQIDGDQYTTIGKERWSTYYRDTTNSYHLEFSNDFALQSANSLYHIYLRSSATGSDLKIQIGVHADNGMHLYPKWSIQRTVSSAHARDENDVTITPTAYDVVESSIKVVYDNSPYNKLDTDNDGVVDSEDYFPDDSARTNPFPYLFNQYQYPTDYAQIVVAQSSSLPEPKGWRGDSLVGIAGTYEPDISDSEFETLDQSVDGAGEQNLARMFRYKKTTANTDGSYDYISRSNSGYYEWNGIQFTESTSLDFYGLNAFAYDNLSYDTRALGLTLVQRPGPNPPFYIQKDSGTFDYPVYKNTYGLGSWHRHTKGDNTYYMEDSNMNHDATSAPTYFENSLGFTSSESVMRSGSEFVMEGLLWGSKYSFNLNSKIFFLEFVDTDTSASRNVGIVQLYEADINNSAKIDGTELQIGIYSANSGSDRRILLNYGWSINRTVGDERDSYDDFNRRRTVDQIELVFDEQQSYTGEVDT